VIQFSFYLNLLTFDTNKRWWLVLFTSLSTDGTHRHTVHTSAQPHEGSGRFTPRNSKRALPCVRAAHPRVLSGPFVRVNQATPVF
jgi:hypothetical protein